MTFLDHNHIPALIAHRPDLVGGHLGLNHNNGGCSHPNPGLGKEDSSYARKNMFLSYKPTNFKIKTDQVMKDL